MKPFILSSSICTLIAACVITMPKPAFGENDEDDPNKQLGLEDKVPGDEEPDFSFMETGEVEQAPEPVAKPSGKPVAVPPIDPATPAPKKEEEVEVPAMKPGQEEPMPDLEAEQKAAAKAKAEKELADKAAADAVKPPEEIKLPTLEEVEAMQPKPGAPVKVIESFKKLKDEIVKPALAKVKQLETELQKAREIPALDDAVKAKLQQAEEDRAWRESFELQNDPQLVKQFEAEKEKVEGSLFGLLGGPRLKMKPEAIKALQTMGLDSKEGREATGKILAAVEEMKDPLLYQKVIAAFQARDNVSDAHSAKLEELKGKQGSLVEIKAAREKSERQAWGKEVDQHVTKLVSVDPELFFTKQVPETASKEEKEAAAAHNLKLQKEVVPAFHDGIRAIHARDPEKTMSYLVSHIRLPAALKSLEVAKAQLDEAKKRIAELESDGSRVRRIRPSQQAPAAPVAVKKSVTDLTAADSFAEFEKEKGLGNGNLN